MAYKSLEINNARAVYKQAPKTSQFYVGFSSIDIANTNSKFNTRKGERVMNPEFGSYIWDIIMEPMTSEIQNVLENDITTICNSDPRVVPTEIKISDFNAGYLIEITLQLVGTDQSANLILNFDQEVGLLIQ